MRKAQLLLLAGFLGSRVGTAQAGSLQGDERTAAVHNDISGHEVDAGGIFWSRTQASIATSAITRLLLRSIGGHQSSLSLFVQTSSSGLACAQLQILGINQYCPPYDPA